MSNSLGITIDRSSPIPLYRQVADGIEGAIRNGRLAPGSKLENEIDFAASLNLSRPTMRTAMDELVRAGLLVRKRGVGTQVVANQVRRTLELTSLFDDLSTTGSIPTTSILSFMHVTAPPEIVTKLAIPSQAKVYHFNRLRKVNGAPLALMDNWVRDDIIAIDEQQLSAQGLYSVLRSGGVNFRQAQQRIGATTASEYQAEKLEIEVGSALVTMERTAVDDTGRMVETGSHVYRADQYSFEMTLVQR